MNKVVVSLDVENWYHGPAVSGSDFAAYASVTDFLRMQSGRLPEMDLGVLNALQVCLEMLASHGIRATFFVVAEFAARYPNRIREIQSHGHELACHGLYHHAQFSPSRVEMRYDERTFSREVVEAKSILEDIVGSRIDGYRAPSAYVSGAMIDLLEAAGFRYDSSVAPNSFYDKSDGTAPRNTTRPFFPKPGTLSEGPVRSIIEFPWPHYRFLGVRFPTGGGPFVRLFGGRYIWMGVRQSRRRGHTGFYFHPLDIVTEPLPKLGRARPFYFARTGRRARRSIDYVLGKVSGLTTTFAELCDTMIE